MIDAGDGLPLTLPALWRARATERGDGLLLVCDDERLTYSEADARSARLAKGLIAAGATKGSHVALLLPNNADFIVAMLATLRIGAVLLPMSTLSTPDEIGWLLANSDSQYLIAASRYRSQDFRVILSQALPGLDVASSVNLYRTDTPWLRRIWFTDDEGRDGTLAELERMSDGIGGDLLAAAEARVSPRRPRGYHPHFGLHESAQRRDPHARGDDPASRQHQPHSRFGPGRNPVFAFALVLGRRLRLLPVRNGGGGSPDPDLECG
jgi:acyl-CoA synthetase (AMP-forming)/AMP-acid ligase II